MNMGSILGQLFARTVRPAWGLIRKYEFSIRQTGNAMQHDLMKRYLKFGRMFCQIRSVLVLNKQISFMTWKMVLRQFLAVQDVSGQREGASEQ